MSQVRLGCAGWSYPDWVGPFYPPGTPAGDMLSRYARVFDLVEVDGTHYAAPDRDLCARWAARTGASFQFCPKLPATITHEAKLRGVEGLVSRFLDAVEPLRGAGKLGPVLAQMGPDFVRGKDEEALSTFLADWPADVPLAVEFRNASWWDEATYATLRRHGATLVWAFTHHGRTPPVRTTDTVYLRLIGDRELTRFDRIQRDDGGEIQWWADRLRDEEGKAMRVFVIANNHFLGFGPGTLVRVAQTLGSPAPDLAAAARQPGQPGLSRFDAAP